MLPQIDLTDPVAARAGFDELVAGHARPRSRASRRSTSRTVSVPGWEGDPDVGVRIYRPEEPPRGRCPASCMIHGGGFIIGSVEAEHAGAAADGDPDGSRGGVGRVPARPRAPVPGRPARLLQRPGVPGRSRPTSSGVDPDRLALLGASAGGGLAAATALLARDLGGPPLCFQMLHIPELDDRLETPSMRTFVDSPLWNRPLAVQSWEAYLGAGADPDDVSPYAAPARATDLSGLPPAYISTAENDPLRDEGILYGLGPPPGRRVRRAPPVPRHLPRLGPGGVGRRLQAGPARERDRAATGPRGRLTVRRRSALRATGRAVSSALESAFHRDR